MKTLRPNISPSGVVRPKSALNSLPADEYQGMSQPILSRTRSISSRGATETHAIVVSRWFRCAR